ncbi:lysozyme-like protein [Rhizobium phaseoli]|uniref:phage GP46 family protein n=1 Tax=Rhizobium phaseoli TaxID=396 RepID=UPI0007EB2EFB|nr:phage GP46 family protein [Rhizobium phaseoli]ANM05221.1 lysozyme-like protein [Rhizobium phaseoli]
MFLDLALRYDRDARRCDLALGDDYDLALDETPIPAILLSIGLDRRAAADDPLPEGRSQFLAPASFSERRGCAGDALDPYGDKTGCRFWLLDRAKQTETTRQLGTFWLEEGLAWAKVETGEPAEIEVAWLGAGILGYRVQVQDESVMLSRRVEA